MIKCESCACKPVCKDYPVDGVPCIARKSILERLDRECEHYHDAYVLGGVMLSVDKFLEGDELKQDEVHRGLIMREKVLKLLGE